MDIRLKSLHLENFKCHKSLTIDVDGQNASIYGDNATGKTSIYDALTWLLFGKDSSGNGEKNMEIKPLAPDGTVKDHQAVTEVEAVLLANGEEVSLRRTYHEVWSTKRGSAEAAFDGNTSEYYVNGVPCKANSYKAQVADLVDEDQFRLLTTVSYFADTLPWQKRRETLFSLFGGMADLQIMRTDSRFDPLLAAMGRHSLDNFKKVLASKRKGYITSRNEIPARISECEKTVKDLSALDFDEADAQLDVLRNRHNTLNAELLAIQQNTAVQQKKLELAQEQMELDRLEAENRMYRDGQKQDTPPLDAWDRERRHKADILAYMLKSLDMRLAEIPRCDIKIEQARAKWKEINAEGFSGSDTCPTCGQALPEAQMQSAIASFEADKRRRMDALVTDSQNYKERKALCQTDAEKSQRSIQELEKELSELDRKTAAAKDSAESIVIRDMEGYAEKKRIVQGRMSSIKAELDNLQNDSFRAANGIRERISEVCAEIARVSGISGKRSAYEYALGRIEQLRRDAQEAANCLSELDKLLYLIDEYSRYKAGFVEGSINTRFRIANFRLFREQANGGTEDRCDVVYDGVPYMGLNNGMKINVGIDIINTLSRAYGVTVPLFIDNAESVTNLEKTDCQMIRLVVSEHDKELRINHEN